MEAESVGAERVRIEDKVYLCSDCLVLYVQLEMLSRSFIVQVSNHGLKCDVCGRPAVFVAIPYERGIWICEKCYREHVKTKRNHIWTSYRVEAESDDATCDLCGARGAKHIVPLPKKQREPILSVEEDLFGRD